MVSNHGHSSKVLLTLLVGDREFGLSRVGPGEVGLRECCDPIPPSDGAIVVNIDGVEHRRNVFFPNGIGTDGERVVYF